MSRTCGLVLAISAAMMLSGGLRASTIAVIPGGGGLENHSYNGDVSFGWQFILVSTVTVTDLGYFDAGNDGLFDTHPVGIFNSTGSLLVSATVPAGTTGTLLDGFRFTAVPAAVLGPGSYTIGAYANSSSLDDFLSGTSLSTPVSGLTLGTAVQSDFGSSSLTFPTQNDSFAAEGFFGPNFITSDVPEPDGWSMLALGMLALMLVRRRAV